MKEIRSLAIWMGNRRVGTLAAGDVSSDSQFGLS